MGRGTQHMAQVQHEAGTVLQPLATEGLKKAATNSLMQAPGALTSFKPPEDLVETPDDWPCGITKAQIDDVQAEKSGEVILLKGMGMPCCGCICPTTGAIVQKPDGRVKHVSKQLGCFACCPCACCEGSGSNYLEVTERPVMEKTISPAHAGNRKKVMLMFTLLLGLYVAAPPASSSDSSSSTSTTGTTASRRTEFCSLTELNPSADECLSYVDGSDCSTTYGSICPDGTAVTSGTTLSVVCPDACGGTASSSDSSSDSFDLTSITSVISLAQLISIFLIVGIALEIFVTSCVMKGYWRVEVKGVPEVPGVSSPAAPSGVSLTPGGAGEIINFLKEDSFVIFQTSKEACEAACDALTHKETQQSNPLLLEEE